MMPTPCEPILPAALLDLRSGDAEAALARLGPAPDQESPGAWHALRGMALLAGERWPEARDSLRQAVASGDTTPSTVLNLALSEARLDGGSFARQAIAGLEARFPTWDEPPFRLAEILRADGDLAGAAEAYERALAVAPARPKALLRLATLYIGAGEARRAEMLLIRCCGVDPDNWEAWDALGLTSCLLSDHAAGRVAFRRARALNRASIPIALRLAGAAVTLGDAEAELAQFEQDPPADPLHVASLVGRAALLGELGRDDEALQLLEAAVTIDPDSPEAAAILADRLLRGDRHGETLAALRHAVALDPDNRDLRNNLAVGLTRTHRYAEALAVLDELLAIEGERVDLLSNRSNALVCLGRQSEGVASARRATELATAPDHCHLAWRTLANALAYSEEVTGESLAAVLRTVAATAPRDAADPNAGLAAPRVSRGAPNRRLRLGLLSATLKTHPVGWLTLAGFENLDPDRFEIVCLAQREGADAMQRRFRAIAAEWHPLAERGRRDIAGTVRGLGLDLLIDMSGYGDQGMLSLCARRLAPVQIKWVGMQNHTTALPDIDWFITDRWETPPDLARFYSERLLMLPDGYVCYSPPVHAPDVAALPALRHGAITFGCFNNLAKVTPRVIATWAAILRDLPTARLVLKAHPLADPGTAGVVRRQFVDQGVAGDRLDLRGGCGHRELLAQYGDIDIVLDPFPYSGGLTTCEALWMGVPVLSCPGETFASRHSASHLSNIGLTDWVVPDLDTYRSEAVRRAADVTALSALRSGLRARMRASRLCDAPRFGRHLRQALERAWRER